MIERPPASPSGPIQEPVGRREALAAGALLVAVVGLGLVLAGTSSQTIDERHHIEYARRVLAGNPERAATFENSTMPVSIGNALPSVIADRMPAGAWKNRFGGLFAARLATVGLAGALALLLWRWSRALYGPAGGLVSLALFGLDPNFLAHSHLATTDVAAALGLFGASWAAWRGARNAGSRAAIVEGVWLGAALLAKYFALLLVPVLVAIRALRVRFARAAPPVPLAGEGRNEGRRLLLVAAACLAVIHLGFGFDRAFSRFDTFGFRSTPLERAAEIPGLRALPVPLPDAYVVGFDMSLDAERETHSFGRTYLLGRLYDHGIPGYYLVASLFKVPLPVLLLGLVLAVRFPRLTHRARFLRDEIYLLAPALGFAIYLNFFYNAHIGIRHFLVVFPFGYVLAGSLFQNGWPRARAARLALAALAAWLVLSVAAAFPRYIPYFNELLPDRKLAYRVLSDSNVDWGQARGELTRYLERHPDAIYNPELPVGGRVVVGANSLTGVISGDRFAWLWPLDPVDHVGYSYLVFEVPERFAAAAREAAAKPATASPD
jgi:hypothetical protein